MPDGQTYGHTHGQTENWLSAHPLMMLYICTKVCGSVSRGFRVKDLNSKVNARVVANVDSGWTDIQTNTQKNRSLYPAMPKANELVQQITVEESTSIQWVNRHVYR